MSSPTATLEEEAPHIAPANLTLTPIRETVVALAERSTARAATTLDATARSIRLKRLSQAETVASRSNGISGAFADG